jgi:CheY-like chemotaxis protein
MNGIHSKLVLLVEDDPGDALLLKRAFDKSGGKFSMKRLTNGDELVAYLDGQAPFTDRALHPIPKLVLLDIKLPRRSGLEVLEWLRARTDNLRRLPVIMLTSSRHSVDVNRSYELGANSYLAKPDTPGELNELIGTLQTYWSSNEEPTV